MTWNSFTRVMIEPYHMLGTGPMLGTRQGTDSKGQCHGIEFSLFCASPGRARLLILWAPSCQALHKVPYIPLRGSASGYCADERS